MPKRKLIVVTGTNASGKSALAVLLANKYGGEVVSADSRQVYRGLDLGSGKVTRDRSNTHRMETNKKRIFGAYSRKFAYHSGGVRHHLLDVASPKRTFTAAHYQKLALRAIRGIWRRGKVPILCGGTGLYIRTVVDGIVIPDVKPDARLRARLEEEISDQLYSKLKKLDPERAKTVDRYNKRRLVRALEIIAARGKVPKLTAKPIDADVLILGVTKDRVELERRIRARLAARLKQGMVAEVKRLHTPPVGGGGISWKRLENFGLEYRYIARFLQNKISRERMVEELVREIRAYAKRQIQWWKRDPRVVWIKNPTAAHRLVKNFLC